ncbi:MAG: hypothetical protein ACJA1L_002785 [Paracoccaceae bacterium]
MLVPTLSASTYAVLRPAGAERGLPNAAVTTALNDHLRREGWALPRGVDVGMARFSGLIAGLCRTITFDRARDNSAENTPTVDAGLGPIGLHVENGNTPRRPDIVAFYARRAAFEGSQAMICDACECSPRCPPSSALAAADNRQPHAA